MNDLIAKTNGKVGDFMYQNGKLTKYTGPGGVVELPSGTKEITVAFQGRNDIEKIIFPDNDVVLFPRAFTDCMGLVDEAGYIIVNDVLFGYYGQELKNVVIPDGIARISYFSDCNEIESLVIPESVKTIDKDAFGGIYHARRWENIRKAVIPDELVKKAGLTGIGSSMDLDGLCKGMLNNPEGFGGELKKRLLSNIGKKEEDYVRWMLETENDSALVWYLSQAKVISAENLDKYIQISCLSASFAALFLEYKKKHYSNEEILKKKEIQNEKELGIRELTVSDWRKIFSLKLNKDHTACIAGIKEFNEDIIVPEKIGEYTVNEIAPGAFQGIDKLMQSKWKEYKIVLPDSIVKIGEEAFAQNKYLSEVRLSDSMTELPNRAFWNCRGLKAVKLPKKLKTIKDDVFFRCDKLSHIEFPPTLKSIGKSAFAGCAALTFDSIPDGVATIKYLAFNGIIGSETIVLPKKLKIIDNILQNESGTVKEIRIQPGTEKIYDSVFSHCYGLESVYVPETVTEIGHGFLEFCKNVTIYSPAGSKMADSLFVHLTGSF